MNKKIYFASIVFATVMTASNPLIHININDSQTDAVQKNTGITTYAEETKWYYRTVDGKLQKRLWSITYSKWLTDWMWI